MPIQTIRNDITKIECDTIVNVAKSTFLGGDDVDEPVIDKPTFEKIQSMKIFARR